MTRRQAHNLRRATRLARQAAQTVLQRTEAPGPAVEDLRHKAALLEDAPRERIVAIRRRQGACSRKQTTARDLFDACTEIRRRIAAHYRHPKYADLRRAFGVGVPVGRDKPQVVLRLAAQILEAAQAHPEALRAVRVGPPSLRKVEALRDGLLATMGQVVELRGQQKQVLQGQWATAVEVKRMCDEIKRGTDG